MFKFKLKKSAALAVAILGAGHFAAASAVQTSKIYNEFQISKTSFLNSQFTAKDFAKKFKTADAELNAKYVQLKAVEGDDLSIEGNQIALDLELLSPLRKLATSKINKETCNEAIHLNEMNSTPVEKMQLETIEKLIKMLCQ